MVADMIRRYRRAKTSTPKPGVGAGISVLPTLATAEQIAGVLQVSSRSVLLWAEEGTIPTALRKGRVIRFYPPAVAIALGLSPAQFGWKSGEDYNQQEPNDTKKILPH